MGVTEGDDDTVTVAPAPAKDWHEVTIVTIEWIEPALPGLETPCPKCGEGDTYEVHGGGELYGSDFDVVRCTDCDYEEHI